MRGEPLALVEEFDRLGADARFELLFDQRIRHRVVVPLDLDMVVDVHADQFPLGILIGGGWQGPAGRAIN